MFIRLNQINPLITISTLHQAWLNSVFCSLEFSKHFIIQQSMTDSGPLVHCLYAMKPKTSKCVSLLEKLTGLKSSKKNPVKSIYQVILYVPFSLLYQEPKLWI